MKLLPGIIQLDVTYETMGGVKTDNINEIAEVIGVADNVTKVKVGDKLVFKAWACYIVNDGGTNLYFINEDSEAILGVK